MFRSNFVESSSKQCAFCNISSPDSGALVTHMGASASKCTYHVNCVAAEILNGNCPKCDLPVNAGSLEQFKARTVEHLKPAVPSINYEEEVAACRQLEQEFVQDRVDRDAAAARALQQQFDLEVLRETQDNVETKLRDEDVASKLQKQFDAETGDAELAALLSEQGDAPVAPDADLEAALSLDAELNGQPSQAPGVLHLPLAAFAERPAAPAEHDRVIRRCNPLSILTRNRLICAAITSIFVACFLARF